MVTVPTLSLWMFRSMMTLSSGVICGLTLSDSVAFLNETLVAPLEVACWYGISVPCSIVASIWSAVMTRGLEMILPLPSACSAETSRFRKRVRLVVEQQDHENTPGLRSGEAGAGRLTPSEVVQDGTGDC